MCCDESLSSRCYLHIPLHRRQLFCKLLSSIWAARQTIAPAQPLLNTILGKNPRDLPLDLQRGPLILQGCGRRGWHAATSPRSKRYIGRLEDARCTEVERRPVTSRCLSQLKERRSALGHYYILYGDSAPKLNRPVERGSSPLTPEHVHGSGISPQECKGSPHTHTGALGPHFGRERKLIRASRRRQQTAFQHGEKSMRHPFPALSFRPTTADGQAGQRSTGN
ncbi:hypothetical protein BGW80DRAFT_92055 [Lactifluus volemus]|nr:hypothetical protein BGW80DRAFT_92055 [Lactifluus volemus]